MDWFGRDTSLIHLLDSILCSISIRTTGPYSGYHDLTEICILALDAQLKPSKLAIPFTCLIRPKRPENIDILDKTPKGFAKKKEIIKANLDGIDAYYAADQLDAWVNKFRLKNDHKKIVPLSINWPFVRGFFVDWLGPMNFERLFHPNYRDLTSAGTYVMDRCDFLIEEKKYWKPLSLHYLCTVLKVDRQPPYECTTDSLAIAECYKSMMRQIV